MTLAGKIAWVTGAGSGIGEAGAVALAEAGALVVLSGRRKGELERVARRIGSGGGRAEIAPLDVADGVAAAKVGADIRARHGRLDILVNSAGLNVGRRHWRDVTLEDWNIVIRANLDGTFHCVLAALPAMRERKDGIIVNVASWAGWQTLGFSGAAYNASKRAVVGLTETINMEESKNGVRATALCPAEVATPILDKRPAPPPAEERAKMLQPEDLGMAIRFVAALPPRACVNELVISPTWNRIYLGGDDLKPR